ncbi:hypothetical protein H6P81_015479 [Aristolochia fimbriata]|uniref:Uncharacterized protein n=1 Tax=Aristolochia fimbriata TaxID=158543 RepID=A0AAV7E5W5_ARIFI|nr:hypothetical protein H6P81_015479 [Aristolochia fimbriata]
MTSSNDHISTPLLSDDIVEGAVDYRGFPASRSKTRRWRSAVFIIGVDAGGKFAHQGITSNLINYLTGPLRQPTAEAAKNVNLWEGCSYIFSILGALGADSWLGRYQMIFASNLLYIAALGLLVLSTVPPPSPFQTFFFFAALYLVALGHGGHEPCSRAFGADQFDSQHREETKSKSSFFNWVTFSVCFAATSSIWITTFLQDNVSWGLGFGLLCLSMVVALLFLKLGTPTYRYTTAKQTTSARWLVKVILAAARPPNNSIRTPKDSLLCEHHEGVEEEGEALRRIIPIWSTCLIYGAVYAQSTTLFTKQGNTMQRQIFGPAGFQIPAATLRIFSYVAVIVVVPIYDRLFVPLAKSLTKIPSGVTPLQRVGVGILLSAATMAVAATVESRRLEAARASGLVDEPAEKSSSTVPMSVWWLVPQYATLGASNVFAYVGLQEFFYDQAPGGLRSLGLALYLSVAGVGNFLSGFLISAVDVIGRAYDGDNWFDANLNRAHLDYFYWLLAGLSLIELGLFVYFARVGSGLSRLIKERKKESKKKYSICAFAASTMDTDRPTTALLEKKKDTVEGVVDYRGRPVSRREAGGWRSAFFIMVGETAERFAYYGIASNLINYLTGPFGQSMAEAAASLNIWSGCVSVFPLLGALLGDSFFGRYPMVLAASIVYILGTGMLTLSAVHPSLHPFQCEEQQQVDCVPPTRFQTLFLFTSLYMVALAQGGHKPCVQAFGADQFDAQDPIESRSKSSFFNWLNFALCFGSASSIIIVPFIQDNNSWGLGFSLPSISIAIALAAFLLGTSTYRFTKNKTGAEVFGPLPISSEEAPTVLRKTDWGVLTREAKEFSQLMPIWVSCVFFGVVVAQTSSLFTKQGGTMDRRVLGPRFQQFRLPAAALQSTTSLVMLLLVPLYDRAFVPAARFFTGLPSGITMLQRIGVGLIFSVASMATAAEVEYRRLALVRELGIANDAGATVPMSIWWLLPQFFFYGAANLFVYIGSLEFFYDQMPERLKSVGIAFCLTTYGVGSFVSGILVSAVDKASGAARGRSWLDSNLNRARLDYFYALIAALCSVGFLLFLYFANSYVYRKKSDREGLIEVVS